MSQISRATIEQLLHQRRMVLDSQRRGVAPFRRQPERLVMLKAGDLALLIDWLDEMDDRLKHGGIVTSV